MKSAILPAAGEGRGAWPFCGIRQKVTMPVLNVPMVRRLAKDCIAAGFDEIIVVTGHGAGAVRACLGDLKEVRFVEQHPLNGPVDAVLTGLKAVSSEDVLIAAGDIVTTRATLDALVRRYEMDPGSAAITGAPRQDGLHHWISLVSDKDGLLTGIHPKGGAEHLCFGGMAMAGKALLQHYFERDPGMMTSVHVGAMPPPEGCLAAPFEAMCSNGIPVHCIEAPDFLFDVDRPWQILEANRHAAEYALSRMETTHIAPGASIDDGADIAPDAKLYLESGARIGKGCVVRGSAILGAGSYIQHGGITGAGCILGEGARVEEYGKLHDGAILGAGSVAGHCAEFSGLALDTVLMHHYCCVSAIIGTHVDIGAATVIGTWRFDDGVRGQMVKGHRETPPLHGGFACIGDYSRTGVNAVFMPGVKTGWNCCIGPGVIVSEDIPERCLVQTEQKQIQKTWGPERYGW